MISIRTQHFVTFNAPGTLFSQNIEPIEEWNPKLAVKLASTLGKRYKFFFTSIETIDPLPDGKGGHFEVKPRQVARSGNFYIGGTLRTYDEVVAAKMAEERILRDNMRGNGYWIVVECMHKYRGTNFFNESDIIVDPATGAVLRRGDEPKLVAYRAQKTAERIIEDDAVRLAQQPLEEP